MTWSGFPVCQGTQMKSEKSDCRLCRAVGDTNATCHENTYLYETQEFVVMPCIGPLCPGHIMVVSRNHYPSLASMGSKSIAEYENLAHLLRRSTLYAKCPLEFEHGGTSTDCGGACVLHAHMHWIPEMGEFEAALEGVYPLLGSGNALTEIAAISSPYLFLRGTSQQYRLYAAEGMPSQILRQVICSQLARPDWDWKQDRHDDWIEGSHSQFPRKYSR
jgi:ATP adenylyltransferase